MKDHTRPDTNTDPMTSSLAGICTQTHDKAGQVKVLSPFGMFSSIVRFNSTLPGNLIAATVDGPGAKFELAMKANRLNTVGPCLLNHGINDLIAHGAKAAIMLSYLGAASSDPEKAQLIIGSIGSACQERRIALLGGDTAIVPRTYLPGAFELVSFLIGSVQIPYLHDGLHITSGDRIFGLASSGFHNNGYTLLQSILSPSDYGSVVSGTESTWLDELLKPTRAYDEVIFRAAERSCQIHGMANITGGGIPGNLRRILPDGCSAIIRQGEIESHIPPIMSMAQVKGNVPWTDMVTTFNLGVGFIVVVPQSSVDALMKASGNTAFEIGEIVQSEQQTVLFNGNWGEFPKG